ncbi:MAG: hypothetical protein Q9166_006887 [cf. Caloplaca sp. 2 TL-2023]
MEEGKMSATWSTSASSKEPIYKPTVEAYNQWAATYDVDGNFLQALDTIEMEHMLPYLFSALPLAPKLVDLGCGTGRNTAGLMRFPGARILGVDNSQGMLDKAESRCRLMWKNLPEGSRAESIEFDNWDMLPLRYEDDIPDHIKGADAIVSTLVVEHIPLPKFFMACSKMVKPGGHVLCTNMHPEMGAISQAGFVDPATKGKVRPVSYAHTIEDFLLCASRWDFTVFWGPQERKVRESDLVRLGERGRKWVEVNAWFGVILRKGLWRNQEER